MNKRLRKLGCCYSGKGRIGQATRERVLEFIEKHDYRPNAMAKGLAQEENILCISWSTLEPEEGVFHFEWLKEKYQTIENLNDRWCTTFWSHTYNNFDQIEAPSKIGETQLHALNLDWRRFVTHQTAERKASGRFTESNRR